MYKTYLDIYQFTKSTNMMKIILLNYSNMRMSSIVFNIDVYQIYVDKQYIFFIYTFYLYSCYIFLLYSKGVLIWMHNKKRILGVKLISYNLRNFNYPWLAAEACIVSFWQINKLVYWTWTHTVQALVDLQVWNKSHIHLLWKK